MTTPAKIGLVGRSREMGLLSRRISERQAVCLVGEAGIGKTALMRAAAGGAEGLVFEGGGLSGLSWMPYMSLKRALRRNALPGDAAAVFDLVRSDVGTGLLLLDDLQWADHDTLKLLPFLAGRLRVLGSLRRDDPKGSSRLPVLKEAGFEFLEVGPLSHRDAEALVRAHRHGITDHAVRTLVDRAGGNPLFLEELAVSGEAGAGLELAVTARLRRLSPEAQESMAELGLLGRPADRSLIGPGVDELLRAGLALEKGVRVEPRHALLGEAAARYLSGEERRAIHSRLAGAVGDLGEAARHHLAAGERKEAHGKALQAAARAERPGERAKHLGIAAASATGPEADRLRIDAATALVDAGNREEALRLLNALEDPDPDLRAEASLQRGRAFFYSGRFAHAEAEFETGLEFSRGSGSPTEVKLLIERTSLQMWHWNPQKQLELAKHALSLARTTGHHIPRASLVMAMAEYMLFDRGCIERFKETVREARSVRDVTTELEAQEYLCGAYQSLGQAERAMALASAMIERARNLALRGLEVELRFTRARTALMASGPSSQAIQELEELLEYPQPYRTRAQMRADLALALATIGEDEEARRLLDEAGSPEAPDWPLVRIYLLLARAETDFLAGRAGAARSAASELLEDETYIRWLGGSIAGWAALDLGQPAPVVSEDHPTPVPPLVSGSVPETEGLVRLTREQAADAEPLFEEAAGLWAGNLLHHEIRARFGAGEAARRAGHAKRARATLLAAEERAADHGFTPILGRIRRSLRMLGEPRSSPRTRGRSTLTNREREVLSLVGRGLTSPEIGRALGLAPSTVDSQIKSAMRKLGAKTRVHAAVMEGQKE